MKLDVMRPSALIDINGVRGRTGSMRRRTASASTRSPAWRTSPAIRSSRANIR